MNTCLSERETPPKLYITDAVNDSEFRAKVTQMFKDETVTVDDRQYIIDDVKKVVHPALCPQGCAVCGVSELCAYQASDPPIKKQVTVYIYKCIHVCMKTTRLNR